MPKTPAEDIESRWQIRGGEIGDKPTFVVIVNCEIDLCALCKNSEVGVLRRSIMKTLSTTMATTFDANDRLGDIEGEMPQSNHNCGQVCCCLYIKGTRCLRYKVHRLHRMQT